MTNRSWFEYLMVIIIFIFAFLSVGYVHFMERTLQRDKLVLLELESARRGVIAFYLFNNRSPENLAELNESRMTNYETGKEYPYLAGMQVVDEKIIGNSKEKYIYEAMNSWVYSADKKYLSW